jgi:hypothetical protein
VCAHTRHELDELLDETHRRLVGQQIDGQVHSRSIQLAPDPLRRVATHLNIETTDTMLRADDPCDPVDRPAARVAARACARVIDGPARLQALS